MKKKILRTTGLILALGLLSITILVHPNFLFAHTASFKNYHIHSDRPIAGNINLVIDDVLDRIMIRFKYPHKQSL